MGQKSIYRINLVSLNKEQECFEYHLDDTFFSKNDSYAISGGDVDVSVAVSLSGNVFSFTISYEGEIETSCDRCLDPVYYDVDFTHEFVAKFTDNEYEEDEDIVSIPRKDGFIDLAQIMIEDLSLSLPIVITHEDGDCNEEMMAKIEAISIKEIPEDGIEKDEEGIDARWAALKQLKKD